MARSWQGVGKEIIKQSLSSNQVVVKYSNDL